MAFKPLSDGLMIPHTPSSAVTAGDVVIQSGLVGVAAVAIAASAKGSLQVSGRIKCPKPTGEGTDYAAGTWVYYDSGDEQVNNDQDNTAFGLVCVQPATTDTTVDVWLVPGAAMEFMQMEDLQVADGGTITFGDDDDVTITHATDGITIGAADEKLAFWGGTPAVQPSHIADPAATASDPDALTAATMTDNSGGTDPGDDIIAAITNAANAGSADIAPTTAAIAQLAAKANALLADVTSIRTQLVAALDDIQANNAAIDSINAVLAATGITAAS